MIDTNTDTVTTEPRDDCFGGTCATCDGPNGQCTCPCHARAQQQDQQEQEQEQEQATPRTLDDLIAQRLDDIARDNAEALDAAERKQEGHRQDELTAFEARLPQKIAPHVLDALRATITYDREGATDTTGTEDSFRGPCARFTYHDETWTIRRDHYYGDQLWMLDGPNGYHVQLAQDWDWDTEGGDKLLEALTAYPQWLDNKQQREREQTEKAEAKAAQPKREPPAPFAYIAGDDPSHHGFLNTNARVWIKIETPETGEYGGKTETIRAQVIDWSDTWLLLNEDDDETQQRLIPITRVVSIHVRA